MLFGIPFHLAARAAILVAAEVETAETASSDEPVIRHVETDDGRHVLAEADGKSNAWISSRKTLPLGVYR
jgi:hypothetical protein